MMLVPSAVKDVWKVQGFPQWNRGEKNETCGPHRDSLCSSEKHPRSEELLHTHHLTRETANSTPVTRKLPYFRNNWIDTPFTTDFNCAITVHLWTKRFLEFLSGTSLHLMFKELLGWQFEVWLLWTNEHSPGFIKLYLYKYLYKRHSLYEH